MNKRAWVVRDQVCGCVVAAMVEGVPDEKKTLMQWRRMGRTARLEPLPINAEKCTHEDVEERKP